MKQIKIDQKSLYLFNYIMEILVQEYHQNNQISCIYMNQIMENETPTIKLVVVGEDTFPDVKLNSNIPIKLTSNQLLNYDRMMASDESIIACRELYQSKILLDRTGYYRNLQQNLGYSKIARTQVYPTFSFEQPLEVTKIKL